MRVVGQQMPGQPDDLWQWCLAQSKEVVLDLRALCAACTMPRSPASYGRLAANALPVPTSESVATRGSRTRT
jgi:hypothetical protein